MIARFLLAGAALLGLIAAAPRDDVVGAWSFKTASFDGGCVMTGTLVVLPGDAQGHHVCRLTTMEVCPRIKGGAEESCDLTSADGAVTITSTITRGPAPPSGNGPGPAYEPDNFTLKLETAARMSGKLHSGGGAGSVVFFRGPGAVS